MCKKEIRSSATSTIIAEAIKIVGNLKQAVFKTCLLKYETETWKEKRSQPINYEKKNSPPAYDRLILMRYVHISIAENHVHE